jgi:hypothetical protein
VKEMKKEKTGKGKIVSAKKKVKEAWDREKAEKEANERYDEYPISEKREKELIKLTKAIARDAIRGKKKRDYESREDFEEDFWEYVYSMTNQYEEDYPGITVGQTPVSETVDYVASEIFNKKADKWFPEK